MVALTSSIVLMLVVSVVVCLGANPLLFERADEIAPLLGIGIGAYVAARGGSRWTGAAVALVFVGLWFGFWLYVMGRWSPALWIEEGLPRLTLAHLAWWSAALAAGTAGGMLRKIPAALFAFIVAAIFVVVLIASDSGVPRNGSDVWQKRGDEETLGPTPDGTMAWLHTFEFRGSSGLDAGIYDCDSDDANPDDDANTTYMGQDLATLVRKLNFQKAAERRQILCSVNGGFFGASGWSVARHEEPLVVDGHVLYEVDLLRPKNQAWFFTMNPQAAVEGGHARFSMTPSLPSDDASNYQPIPGIDPHFALFPATAWSQWVGDNTVLGGVRPLRFEGKSLELKPGAGVTTLKCSRTSVGWNADGSVFYVLTVFDPDGELASQLQRRSKTPQTGGWDVAQVQKFWEDRGVPYALLFDGGESTQLAYRQPAGTYFYLPSGYQYSFTLGYFRQRPLRFTLPILPPSEAHRGVLNYFYLEGPANGLAR